MSRDFDGAGDYIRVDTAPLTAAPFTMSAWAQIASAAGQGIMWLGDKDASNEYWVLKFSGVGDKLAFDARTSAGTETANTDNTYTVNTWHHCCARTASATDRTVTLDASHGDEGVNITSRAPANADRITLGIFDDSSQFGDLDGKIAEAALWNVELSDAEVTILALGVSPLLVRPANLVRYRPLLRNTIDLMSNISTTVSGTTVDVQPTMVYPHFQRLIVPAVVTGMLPFNTVKQTGNFQDYVGGMNG